MPIGTDIGPPRAKLEAPTLAIGQGADDEGYGDELDQGLATLSEEPAEYWSARAALPWN